MFFNKQNPSSLIKITEKMKDLVQNHFQHMCKAVLVLAVHCFFIYLSAPHKKQCTATQTPCLFK